MTEQFKLPTRLKLEELKNKECTVAELQAALVYLIERYNEQGKLMEKAIHELQESKVNKEWRATI